MLIWLVNEKDVHEMPFDDTGKLWCVEASSLELRPGQWPERLMTEDLGDGTDFINKGWCADDVMLYVQPSTGAELHVMND